MACYGNTCTFSFNAELNTVTEVNRLKPAGDLVIIVKDSALISQETHYISVTKANQLPQAYEYR
jgi:hypothetical protein